MEGSTHTHSDLRVKKKEMETFQMDTVQWLRHNEPNYELDDNVMSKVICCKRTLMRSDGSEKKKLLIIIIRRQRTTKDRSEANHEM